MGEGGERERERKREGEREREREREREADRQTDRQTDRLTEKENEITSLFSRVADKQWHVFLHLALTHLQALHYYTR